MLPCCLFPTECSLLSSQRYVKPEHWAFASPRSVLLNVKRVEVLVRACQSGGSFTTTQTDSLPEHLFFFASESHFEVSFRKPVLDSDFIRVILRQPFER